MGEIVAGDQPLRWQDDLPPLVRHAHRDLLLKKINFNVLQGSKSVSEKVYAYVRREGVSQKCHIDMLAICIIVEDRPRLPPPLGKC